MPLTLRGCDSAELREHYVRWEFAPVAAMALRSMPKWHSVTLAVAQYWSDEASDAVHTVFLPSSSRDPGWPVPPEADSHWDTMQKLREQVFGDPYRFYGDNYALILAFASYCRFGCHQEMPVEKAYLPYAIARRDGASSISIEVVGEVQQEDWESQFLRPSRAQRYGAPMLRDRVEAALRGRPISIDDLLEALDGPSHLAELVAAAWDLRAAAQLQLDTSSKATRKILQAVEQVLSRQGLQ